MTQTLTILTWPDYIAPQTLQQFKTEFDVTVQLAIVPSAVELIERMHVQDVGVDVLIPPDYAVRELNGQGRLATLNHSLVPNLKHLDPRFRTGRPHDFETRVSIIKDWGTTGFMYRTDRIHESPQLWKDFWNLAAKYSGHITVLDSPGEVIGAALKMRGRPYNDSSSDALAAARDDLFFLKSHLRAFETNYKPLLASGEAWLSLGWNGDAAVLKTQGIPIKYIVPSEGSQIWEDDWAIAADAPNPELAHSFLNFVLRPEVAAQEARYTRYATGNQSALEYLDDEICNDPATYPPQDLLHKLEAGMPLDEPGRKRREELWAEIKS
jgi:spermidine/putrescine transport system substrate-binding protein